MNTKLMSFFAAVQCLLGFHQTVADINARYDRCQRCAKRWRAV